MGDENFCPKLSRRMAFSVQMDDQTRCSLVQPENKQNELDEMDDENFCPKLKSRMAFSVQMDDETRCSLMQTTNKDNDLDRSYEGQNRSTSLEIFKGHVTPDNLRTKLQLHRKTELSEFFQIIESKYL